MGAVKEQRHSKDLSLRQIVASLPVLRFSLRSPAACSICQISAEAAGAALAAEEGSELVHTWVPWLLLLLRTFFRLLLSLFLFYLFRLLYFPFMCISVLLAFVSVHHELAW